MSESLIATLVTVLVGSAGLAGIATFFQQVTRSARLRVRIAKDLEVAKSFDSDSLPARSAMLSARNAAIELSARQNVVFDPIGMAIALWGLFVCISVWSALAYRVVYLSNGQSTSLASVLFDFPGSGATRPYIFDWLFWVLAVCSVLGVRFAALPWIRLRHSREVFARSIVEDPLNVDRAAEGGVRIVVVPYVWFGLLQEASHRRFRKRR